MSQRDNFAGGFFVGVAVGSIVGGIIGAALASRRTNIIDGEKRLPKTKGNNLDSAEGIEIARRTLEDKIAQLNLVIDDVRQQLGEVNEKSRENDQ
jgi:hypothetical protein